MSSSSSPPPSSSPCLSNSLESPFSSFFIRTEEDEGAFTPGKEREQLAELAVPRFVLLGRGRREKGGRPYDGKGKGEGRALRGFHL